MATTSKTQKMSDATKLTGMERLIANLPSGSGCTVSEAQGFEELWTLNVLPKPDEDRAVFEAMGLVFGDEVDDLFISCTLPPGWKKVRQWLGPKCIYLHDQLGRKRAFMLYMNTPHNRHARIEIETRITFDVENVGDGTWFAAVKDGDTILHAIEENESDYDKVYSKAVEWASQYFPDRDNPLAYWDVEDLKTLIR